MRLFVINPDTQEVEMNKEWIFLIPELALLIKRDKGSVGDYRGEKKLKARKEFTYIYFMEDFSSPLRDWETAEKKDEALRCACLTAEDIDRDLLAAQAFYAEFIRKCSRSLRTLDALYKGMDALDKWFADIDFEKKDSLKRAVYTAKDYIDNVKNLPKMKSAIKEFEDMVQQELKENTGIRGRKILGDMEGQRRGGWQESGPPSTDEHSKPREVTEL